MFPVLTGLPRLSVTLIITVWLAPALPEILGTLIVTLLLSGKTVKVKVLLQLLNGDLPK